MVGQSQHVYKAQATRGWTFIPSWIPGQIFLDITVMVMILELVIIWWYYTVHFWDFLVDIPGAARQERFPITTSAVRAEVRGYSFATSLADVPAAAALRAGLLVPVWVKRPHVSFPLVPLLGLAFLACKARFYQYTIEVDGYPFFRGDAVVLLTLSLALCAAEFVAISLGNVKVRRDRRERARFRVKEGRCPVCTRPVSECGHKVDMDTMKVFNQWDRAILDFHQDACELGTRTLLLCACPCAAGDVALGAGGTDWCCMTGLAYGVGMWLGWPFGLHALVGAYHRWRLRKLANIEGTLFRDWVEHWFCPLCALVQEKHQLEVLARPPPPPGYRTTGGPQLEEVLAAPEAQEILREGVPGLEGIAGGLTADLASQIEDKLLSQAEKGNMQDENKVWIIRRKMYMEDMRAAVAAVAREAAGAAAGAAEDPYCLDGGGAAGGDPGSWRGQLASKWVKDPTTGRWVKNTRRGRRRRSSIEDSGEPLAVENEGVIDDRRGGSGIATFFDKMEDREADEERGVLLAIAKHGSGNKAGKSSWPQEGKWGGEKKLVPSG